MNTTDEKTIQLIDSVKNGERAAFSELIGQYRPLLLSLTARFTEGGGPLDNQEMFAEAALSFYRAVLRYEPSRDVSFGAYAKVCVTHALISEYRKCRKDHSLQITSLDELQENGSLFYGLEEENNDPAFPLIKQEEIEDLYQRAVACLSSYEAAVFDKYIKGYSQKQIAFELKKSEKSVSNAIGRMLVKLRAELR
jgi:RNA polymerase sporulation-specific sigma factor